MPQASIHAKSHSTARLRAVGVAGRSRVARSDPRERTDHERPAGRINEIGQEGLAPRAGAKVPPTPSSESVCVGVDMLGAANLWTFDCETYLLNSVFRNIITY